MAKKTTKKSPLTISVGKVNYENCSLYVEGLDMLCPLCRTLVRSGEQHHCAQESTPHAE